jgi:WD40 repeat protein
MHYSITSLGGVGGDFMGLGIKLLRAAACLAALMACSTCAAQPKPSVTNPNTLKPVRTDRYGDRLPEGVRMRLGTTRWQARAQKLAFAPDGRAILCCSYREIATLDVSTGRQLSYHRFQRSEDRSPRDCINLAFSKDRKTVATIESGPQRVRFWDVTSGKRLREFTALTDRPVVFQWSPDGSLLAAVDTRGNFYLWNAHTGAKHRLSNTDLGQRHGIMWLEFSPDSRLLLTAIRHYGLRIWDLREGRMIHEFKVKPAAMGFTPSGKQVTCLVADSHVIRFWSAVTGKDEGSITVSVDEPIYNFEVSPDGTLLAVKGDNRIFLWSVAEHKLLRTLAANAPLWLGFSPDGTKLACFNGYALSLWDVGTGRELNPRPGHAAVVDLVAFAPDGKVLASSSGFDQTLILWDAATGKELRRIALKSRGSSLAFSADGRLLVAGNSEGTARLWEVATGKELRSFSAPDLDETASTQGLMCQLSADAQILAGFLEENHRLRLLLRFTLWETATGRQIARRVVPGCYQACYSPDARRVALAELVASEARDGYVNRLHVQDTLTSRDLFGLPTGYIVHLEFSADSRTLAAIRHRLTSANDATNSTIPLEHRPGLPQQNGPEICMWEVATGKERLRFPTSGSYYLASSANFRLLATLDQHDVCVWEGTTGKQVYRVHLPGETPFPLSSLALSPDGRTLAVGMADTTILTWDLPPQLGQPPQPVKELQQKDLESLWDDLAGTDAAKAYRAIWTLVAVSGKAVPFLSERVHPVTDSDLETIHRLIRDLDSPSFDDYEAVGESSQFATCSPLSLPLRNREDG